MSVSVAVGKRTVPWADVHALRGRPMSLRLLAVLLGALGLSPAAGALPDPFEPSPLHCEGVLITGIGPGEYFPPRINPQNEAESCSVRDTVGAGAGCEGHGGWMIARDCSVAAFAPESSADARAKFGTPDSLLFGGTDAPNAGSANASLPGGGVSCAAPLAAPTATACEPSFGPLLPPSEDLLSNGGFETGTLDAWTTLDGPGCSHTTSTAWSAEGTYSARVSEPGVDRHCGVYQKVPISGGMTYVAAATFRVASGEGQLYLDFVDSGGQRVAVHIVKAHPGDAQRVSARAMAPASATHAIVWLYANRYVYPDDFHVDDARLVREATPVDGLQPPQTPTCADWFLGDGCVTPAPGGVTYEFGSSLVMGGTTGTGAVGASPNGTVATAGGQAYTQLFVLPSWIPGYYAQHYYQVHASHATGPGGSLYVCRYGVPSTPTCASLPLP